MRAKLQIRNEDEESRRYIIRSGEQLVLGRGLDADLHLNDVEVSRRHAKLELRADGLYVSDLGSRNGTHLGDSALRPKAPLRCQPGQTIQLGSYSIAIELSGFGAEEPDTQSMPSAPRLPPEEFEILGEVGSGGLGTVWAARQLYLDRNVAIKVLHADLDVESEDYQRFLREARLYCHVKSPFVVELYDVRLHENTPYLILELIQGPSARERIKEGPLPVPEALKIGEDVAQALVALGVHGIVHRDIKPHNILLSPDGVAKLGDFGLAKIQGDSGSVTKTNVGLGTLPYVAPEQARGAKHVDARTDLYGLGASLYQLLTGRPPFLLAKKRLVEQVRIVLNDEPPDLRRLRPDVPPPVARFVHLLLRKDPAARPQPAVRVATELRSLRETLYPDHRCDPSGASDETWETSRERLDRQP